MKKVAIMTDTVASVPEEIAREYDVKIIPFHINMDGKSYVETEIGKNRLYARLKERENLPTTSPPSIGEFLEAFQELSGRAEAILYISISSALSMEYGTVIEAKEIAQGKFPQTTIEVIDSKTLCSSQLLIILEAAKATAEGKNIEETIARANHMIPRMNELSSRDTLFYLDKGGRILEAKSWAEAESTSSFRAILEIDASTGGVPKPLARAKTKKQIMEKMVDIAKERVGDKKLHTAILHANVANQAEQLKEMVLSQLQCDKLYVTEVSLVAAVHNGQGLIEFGFYSSD